MSEQAQPLRGLARIPLALIDPNPRNPRRTLNGVDELAASIREHGILQPLGVERHGDRFRLRYGHRRLAAAKLLGLPDVPCIIRAEASEPGALAGMVVENMQRRALDPMEEARAFDALIRQGMTTQQVVRATGIPLSTVRARLDLLRLPEPAQRMVTERKLPLGQARDLARQIRVTAVGEVGAVAPHARWHLNSGHPLADTAAGTCNRLEHPRQGRVGIVACGECWEVVIRADERERLTRDPDPQGPGPALREPA